VSLTLREEKFDSADAARLVAALDAELSLAYAPDQMFGKNLRPAHLAEGRGLFIIARLDGKAVGCGALRRLDDSTAEVKRMYVDPDVRGRGVARTVLDHLTDAALRMGVGRLVLETGVHQAAAISLYTKAGFTRIDCWGEYAGTPTSVCFEKTI
jgi:GNAT superfamily N-acetyltransferase